MKKGTEAKWRTRFDNWNSADAGSPTSFSWSCRTTKPSGWSDNLGESNRRVCFCRDRRWSFCFCLCWRCLPFPSSWQLAWTRPWGCVARLEHSNRRRIAGNKQWHNVNDVPGIIFLIFWVLFNLWNVIQCSKKCRVCTKNTWKSTLYFHWNKPGKKRKLEYFTWKKSIFAKKLNNFV